MNRWLAPLLSDSGDEHLLHRLEAFSDVVIGFCLAELTFSLSGGVNNGVLSIKSIALQSFGLGFFMISIMWWFHNRLFAKFFLLNAVSIVANFGMLGALMLMIYFAQAFTSLALHDPNAPRSLADPDIRYWCDSSAVVYGLLGLMYSLGLIARWPALLPADRRFGLHRASASWVGCVMLIVIGSTVGVTHAKSVLDIVAILAIAIALSRVLINRILPDPKLAV